MAEYGVTASIHYFAKETSKITPEGNKCVEIKESLSTVHTVTKVKRQGASSDHEVQELAWKKKCQPLLLPD